jgi:hypothetical protein
MMELRQQTTMGQSLSFKCTERTAHVPEFLTRFSSSLFLGPLHPLVAF